jgi:hypothetical protein
MNEISGPGPKIRIINGMLCYTVEDLAAWTGCDAEEIVAIFAETGDLIDLGAN